MWVDMNLYNFHTNPEQLEGYKNRLRVPKLAYEYARDDIKGRWPEAEDMIAKDPSWARYYEGRFGVKL